MLWKFAYRGVLANRRRTLFLTLSLALSSFVLVVGASLVAGFDSNIESGLRGGFAGDLQVYHSDNPPPKFTAEVPVDFRTIPDAEAVISLLRRDPDVLHVAPRSSASGVILAGSTLSPVILVGIDPQAEADTLRRLLPLDTAVPTDDAWLLPGRPMAKRLQRSAEVTEVTVLIPTADGLFEGDVLTMRSPYRSPGLPFLDEFIAFVPLHRLQYLMDNEGYPGTLVVRLRPGADPTTVGQRLQDSLQESGHLLEVRTWDELAGDLLGMVQVGRYLVGSGFLLVLLVVIIGIGNTLLILMLGRTREIGLMRALGTGRVPIVAMLVTEVLLLSAMAAAVGVAVGGSLCALLAEVGIPATSEAMTYAFGGQRFYPEVRLGLLLPGFLLVALLGPLVALVPAIRASAADPADTMSSPA